jgi:hypothetical protein
MVGYEPDPEQRLILDDAFGIGPDGKSAAFEVGVVCSRQNLKTGSFKQMVLGWLFISEVPLIVWSAHEFDTAKEAHRDLAVLIEGSDVLRKRVKRIYFGNGSESIELLSGQRVLFKARTKTGGRGLSGDRVVLDEAFALQKDHMGALVPTLAVRPDPQLVYGSSAGLANSDVLRGPARPWSGGPVRSAGLHRVVREKGGCLDPTCRHAWAWPGCVLDDPDRWRVQPAARAGAGQRHRADLRVRPLRARRPAAGGVRPRAARLVGRAGGRRRLRHRPLGSLRRRPPPDDVQVTGLAVAVSYDLTQAAVVAAGKDEDGVIHAAPLRHGPGTGWVVDAVRELAPEYPACRASWSTRAARPRTSSRSSRASPASRSSRPTPPTSATPVPESGSACRSAPSGTPPTPS